MWTLADCRNVLSNYLVSYGWRGVTANRDGFKDALAPIEHTRFVVIELQCCDGSMLPRSRRIREINRALPGRRGHAPPICHCYRGRSRIDRDFGRSRVLWITDRAKRDRISRAGGLPQLSVVARGNAQSHFRLASRRELVTLEVTQRHSKRHEANRNDSHENA